MIQNNAEGGTNGVTPTTSDTGSGDALGEIIGPPAGGTLEYTTTQAAHGSLSYRARTDATTGASGVGMTNGSTVTDAYHRLYVRHDAATVTSFNFASVRSSSTNVAILAFSNAKLLQLKGGNGTVIWTSSTTLSENTWWRIEFHIVVDGSTSISEQVRIYAADATSATEDSGTQTGTANSAISNYNNVRSGQLVTGLANVPATGAYVYWDDMRLFDTDWPGPAGLAKAGTGTIGP